MQFALAAFAHTARVVKLPLHMFLLVAFVRKFSAQVVASVSAFAVASAIITLSPAAPFNSALNNYTVAAPAASALTQSAFPFPSAASAALTVSFAVNRVDAVN